MPTIAAHHAWTETDHRPSDDWPADCYVQWGGHGLVLGESESRMTAFFEAMPKGGGFIRGEGATVSEAEADALQQFRKESVCAHLWSRKAYTNGGTICRRCGAFATTMKPIVKLGGFRKPISADELDYVVSGFLQPSQDDGRSKPFDRRLWLRCRVAGIALPAIPDELRTPGLRRSPFAEACGRAIVVALKSGRVPMPAPEGEGLQGVFTALSARSLRRLLDADDAERGVPHPTVTDTPGV